MKRSKLIILLMSAISAFGQYQVNISGTVTEGPAGFPVADQTVYFTIMIGNDSLNVIYDNVVTNDSGFYYYSFAMTGNFARADISTPDCNGTMLSNSVFISDSIPSITQDFVLCINSGGCMPQYTYYPDSTQSGYAYQFIDLSTGNIDSWSWTFGDGTYSTDQNPNHVFPEEGQYEVCLSVNGPDCEATWCQYITVAATGDCYNYFSYQAAGTTVIFQGYHFPEIPSFYAWDFGDGTVGEGQSVSHTYAENGVYFVSLLTNDSMNCSASSNQSVVVGDTIIFSQVFGQVFEGNFPMQQGYVMISSVQNNPGFDPFTDFVNVDSSGVFVFPYVPNGQFVLYAVPEDGHGYLPTYYGGAQHWGEAPSFSSMESGMLFTINLEPVRSAAVWGSGSISGYISESFGRGDLLEHINVILYNDVFESLGFTNVNSDGSFAFEGLADGLYYIYPELPGVNSNIVPVEITQLTQESVIYLNFDGTSILGQEELSIIEDIGTIYPNPASSNAFLSIKCSQPATITMQITDLTGRLCFSNISQVNSGQTTFDLPIRDLVTGVYLLHLSDASGTVVTRKLMKN
jgi:PKD repeat protein